MKTITVRSEGLLVERRVLETLGVSEGAEMQIHREGGRLILEARQPSRLSEMCEAFSRLLHDGVALPKLHD